MLQQITETFNRELRRQADATAVTEQRPLNGEGVLMVLGRCATRVVYVR